MLELRPNCECCDRDLPPGSTEAMICSFECTFCRSCAEGKLGNLCPNCGGPFSQRPARLGKMLERHPAKSERTPRNKACA
ncbi:MAG TPA: DUF1272 domain-containing protein [Myxococcota bacterium]|nr:DUF1272 domain-containing protein [Myxococcota bacterium]